MAGVKTTIIPGRPRLAVDEAGDGKLLVFMHGIGGNRTNWRDQVPVFGEKFRAVAWDARGYGDSDDYDGPLDFADFSADLVRVLDHYGARKALLCGLSMGGRIAQDFYERHPDRVAAMVLVATMPSFGEGLTDAQRAEFIRLRKEPLVNGKEPKDIAPVVAKTLLGPGASAESFDRLVASMTALHKESYIKTIEASMGYRRTTAMAAIKAPVLLIFGEEDKLTTPATGKRMHAAIPGSRYVEIAGAGHLVNIEEPRQFDAAVMPFLLEHQGLAG
ncbi:MAG: alpha/beta fold hydrolase [Alphaproteobacteria bacterium]|nr:alpha/beta fold hydrolase [Alphaproteobacteria bacterium]